MRSQRPNASRILLIIADDLGAGDLSLVNHAHFRTPHLDRLARTGTRFEHFSVASPVCSPSRAAILTGQHPARYCIHQHFASHADNVQRGMLDWLDPTAPSLARLLRDAGFKTATYGKWHLTSTKITRAPSPLAHGYDDWAGWVGPPPEMGWRDVYAASLEWLLRHRRAFVWLAAHEAHKWLKPSAASYAAFGDLSPQQRVYAAVVKDLDDGVGVLLGGLEAAGVADETLTLFLSDNGPEHTGSGSSQGINWQGHDECRRMPARSCASQGCKLACGTWCSVGSTGGLRGGKRSLFQGGVGSPFFVRWPVGGVRAGAVDETSVIGAADLLPTLLSAAGVPLPESDGVNTFDGEDVLEALRGRPIQRRSTPLFWEWQGQEGEPDLWPRLGVRDGHLKLLLAGKRAELYNLSRDRRERRNLASDNVEVVERMRSALLRWHRSMPSLGECERAMADNAARASESAAAAASLGAVNECPPRPPSPPPRPPPCFNSKKSEGWCAEKAAAGMCSRATVASKCQRTCALCSGGGGGGGEDAQSWQGIAIVPPTDSPAPSLPQLPPLNSALGTPGTDIGSSWGDRSDDGDDDSDDGDDDSDDDDDLADIPPPQWDILAPHLPQPLLEPPPGPFLPPPSPPFGSRTTAQVPYAAANSPDTQPTRHDDAWQAHSPAGPSVNGRRIILWALLAGCCCLAIVGGWVCVCRRRRRRVSRSRSQAGGSTTSRAAYRRTQKLPQADLELPQADLGEVQAEVFPALNLD